MQFMAKDGVEYTSLISHGIEVHKTHIKSGAITRLTIAITLISMFIAGPEVSFNGSPTVSATTVAV